MTKITEAKNGRPIRITGRIAVIRGSKSSEYER